MKYKKVVRLYSNSRVSKYYRATNRNKNKAVMLYFANLKIAQAFHPLLSSFEVILRNQLHYALARHFSDGNWIINQKSGFMVDPSLTYINKRSKKKVVNDYILKGEREAQDQRIRALEQEIKNLYTIKMNLQKIIDEYRHSRSWKLTAPMRKAGRAVRAGRKK